MQLSIAVIRSTTREAFVDVILTESIKLLLGFVGLASLHNFLYAIPGLDDLEVIKIHMLSLQFI